MITEAVIVAIIAGVFGFGGSVAGHHFNRGKQKAETSQVIASAAAALVEPLEKRVQKLETENATLRKRVEKLETENQELREENTRLKTKRGML